MILSDSEGEGFCDIASFERLLRQYGHSSTDLDPTICRLLCCPQRCSFPSSVCHMQMSHSPTRRDRSLVAYVSIHDRSPASGRSLCPQRCCCLPRASRLTAGHGPAVDDGLQALEEEPGNGPLRAAQDWFVPSPYSTKRSPTGSEPPSQREASLSADACDG